MTSVISFVIMVDWLRCKANSQMLLGRDDIILHEKRKRKGAWSYRLSSYPLQSCLRPQGMVSKLQLGFSELYASSKNRRKSNVFAAAKTVFM